MEFLKILNFGIAIIILKNVFPILPIWKIISFLITIFLSFYLYDINDITSTYNLLIKSKELNNEDGNYFYSLF